MEYILYMRLWMTDVFAMHVNGFAFQDNTHHEEASIFV